ncbi:MAG: DUF2062 domain-containing protein [Deltaproteobacteria bacterium]
MARMVPRGRRTLLERGKRTFRYIYLRLIRVGGDPVHVALGFSLGVFLGVFPTFGLGIPLAILLASLFRWNRVAATLGSLVMNPLTTPFFWSLSGSVGAALFRADVRKVLENARNGDRIHSLTTGAGIYLAGNLVVSLVFSVAAYFLALRAVTLYRRRKRERRLRRRIRE